MRDRNLDTFLGENKSLKMTRINFEKVERGGLAQIITMTEIRLFLVVYQRWRPEHGQQRAHGDSSRPRVVRNTSGVAGAIIARPKAEY